MPPGRRPTPTHLKIVRGNPGKRSLPTNEPKPKGDLYSPPDWLTASQKANWRYAIANSPKGLLKKLDRAALTAFVVAESIYREAAEQLARDKLFVFVGENKTMQQHPALAIVNKQMGIMLKAAAEMGFTPASRTRIQVRNDLDPANPFEEFA